MSMAFDATLKEIVETYVSDFQERFGFHAEDDVRALNVDLSTISAATDVVLCEGDPPHRIVDLNSQSGPDSKLQSGLLLYNGLLHHRYQAPVHSVLILLRPITRHEELTGRLRYQARPRKGKMDFGYELIRLWKESPRKYLRGGIGLLPLAPLCVQSSDVSEERLRPIVDQILRRLDADAIAEQRSKLLTATYLLMGLNTDRALVNRLFEKVTNMHESSTYQGILDEGKVDALRATVLRQGRQQFGAPTADVERSIKGISNIEQLERMTDKVLVASSWVEVVETR